MTKAKKNTKAIKKLARIEANAAESTARSDLSKMILQAYENEYADKTSLWGQIERKAQGTIVIAAIMLAGGFAFARQLDTSVGLPQKLLLLGVIAALVFSIWQCVKALKVSTVNAPPTADDVRQIGIDLLQLPDPSQLAGRINGLRFDLLDSWSARNQALDEKCVEKAGLVRRSQSAILISALFVAIVTGIHVWEEESEVTPRARHDAMHSPGPQRNGGTAGIDMPQVQTVQEQPSRPVDRNWREQEPDRSRAGQWEEQRRLSASSSFRPVR